MSGHTPWKQIRRKRHWWDVRFYYWYWRARRDIHKALKGEKEWPT